MHTPAGVLHDLVDHSSDLIQLIDPEGRILFANRLWRETLGFDEAELAALRIFDLIEPDCQEHCRDVFARLMRGEEVGVVEVALRSKQGRRVPLEGRISVRLEDGKPTNTRGVFRVASQRRQTETLLRSLLTLREHSSDDLPTLFRTVTAELGKAIQVERASIWLFDSAHESIVCEDLFQRSTEQHQQGLRLRAEDFPSYFHAATRQSAIIADDAHTNPATHEFSKSYLTPLDIRSMLDVPIRSGAELRGVVCLEHTGYMRRWQPDEIKYAIAVANHMMTAIAQCERRRIEQSLQENQFRLARAIEASGLGYWDWDVERGTATFSGHWASMLGYRLEDIEHRFDTWERLVHPEDLPRVLAAFVAHIDNHAPSYSEEIRMKTASGGWRWILTQGKAVRRNAEGRALIVSGIHKDIHDRRIAEDALRELNATLERRITDRTRELQESERFARATVDALTSHVVILDGDGTILMVNQAWQQFLAANRLLPTGRLEGRDYLDLLRAGGGEFGPMGKTVADGIESVLRGATGEFGIEYPFQGQTGRAWFSCRVKRFPGEGSPRVVVEQENITLAKTALERLRVSNEAFRSIAEAQAAYLERGDWKEATTRMLNYSLRETGSQYGFFGVMIDDAKLRVLAHDGIVWDRVKGREFFDAAAALYQKQGYLEFTGLDNLFGHAVRSGEVLLTNSPANDPRAGGLPAGHPPLNNFLGVPVHKGGRVLGLIGLANRGAGFAQEHVERLHPILQTVALLFDGYLHQEAEARLQEQREAAERRSRQALALLDATEDAAFIFDPDSLRFTYVNEGATLQVGYSREELLTMSPLDIAKELDAATLRAHLRPVQGGDVRAKSVTTSHRTKDGRDLPVEINFQHIAPAGEPARFIAIARDITERIRNERHSQRSQRLEAIGTLAGGVAHDLNNALTPILMALDGLRASRTEDAPLIDLLEDSGRRAASMVRQLLTFAKGVEGKRVALAPDKLVEEVLRIVQATFPKNIEAAPSLDQRLPSIQGDATQLHQVLLNLAVNARDAMPQGGKLTIEARTTTVDALFASTVPEARPGNYVMLRVGDTGTGIPPEIIDRIFEPFFSTKTADKGTGLGLSTVMGIVKGHGGFLHVQSQIGRGSCFSVYLPCDPAPGAAAPTEPGSQSFAGKGQRVLFVDDEGPIRKVAQIVFRRLGIELDACADGAEALAKVRELGSSVAGLITDLHMPQMDGVQLVRALRMQSPGLRIAVFSGRLEEPMIEELESLGVHHFLRKPFDQQEVSRFLAEFLA